MGWSICVIDGDPRPVVPSLFFFNDTATTEIYTLSLHDALPIFITKGFQGNNFSLWVSNRLSTVPVTYQWKKAPRGGGWRDRKSTRLNSSHSQISYAVFCLKKKNERRLKPPAPARQPFSSHTPHA